MAYTTIDDPTNYFDVVTYTGDGQASQTITGLGFAADFLWIKNRDATRQHLLGNRLFSPPIVGAYDAVGGSTDTVINLSVAADTSNYVVFNEAIKAGWDGAGLVTINLTLSNNAKIISIKGNLPGLDFRGFPTNCVLTCTVNSGSGVYGCGGDGGAGGGWGSTAPAGSKGGDAIWVDKALTIVNNGTFAGGGGGGGGGAGWAPTGAYGMGGAGGGGGAGGNVGFGGSLSGSSANVSAATNGANGSLTGGGAGGNGSAKDGNTTHAGAAGGAAGAAGGGNTGSHSSWAGQVSNGGAAGAAGKYADYNNVITWSTAGTRTGGVNATVTNGVGILPYLSSHRTDFLTYQTDIITEINVAGFKVGADEITNESGDNLVAWAWGDASTGIKGFTSSNNTDGSINSLVKANTDSGFSYGTYTGTGSAATIGHGLGVVPDFVMAKMLNSYNQSENIDGDWIVYHSANTSAPQTDYLRLNAGDATVDNTYFNDTAPTSTVFSIGTVNDVNQSGRQFQFYAWSAIQGYSKFGSYVGNGNADGPFVYTGFKPAFVLLKSTSNGEAWELMDNKRLGYNGGSGELRANLTNVGTTTNVFDLLSNGFKPRTTAGQWNTNAATYVYMAFAEHPFVSSEGTPVTAR